MWDLVGNPEDRFSHIEAVIISETVGCADPELCKEICGSESGCSNIAYPTLVINLMPAGKN